MYIQLYTYIEILCMCMSAGRGLSSPCNVHFINMGYPALPWPKVGLSSPVWWGYPAQDFAGPGRATGSPATMLLATSCQWLYQPQLAPPCSSSFLASIISPLLGPAGLPSASGSWRQTCQAPFQASWLLLCLAHKQQQFWCTWTWKILAHSTMSVWELQFYIVLCTCKPASGAFGWCCTCTIFASWLAWPATHNCLKSVHSLFLNFLNSSRPQVLESAES